MVEPCRRTLPSGRGELAGGDEGDQHGHNEETDAEHGIGARPGAPSFDKTSSTDDPEIVAPADLAMSP